jgi:ribosomal protein S27AE
LGLRVVIFALVAVMMIAAPCSALELRLSRDAGTSIGGRIKGRFSAKVRDADDVDRVEFYLNGELVYTDSDGPFVWSFKTTDYPPGNYTIRAVGYLGTGGEEEDSVTTEFVETFGKFWTLYLWGTILFVAGMAIFSLWVIQRERKRPQGKTKCPQCGSIFDRKWSPFHMGAAYRNTCPMCGRSFWANEISEDEVGEGAKVF